MVCAPAPPAPDDRMFPRVVLGRVRTASPGPAPPQLRDAPDSGPPGGPGAKPEEERDSGESDISDSMPRAPGRSSGKASCQKKRQFNDPRGASSVVHKLNSRPDAQRWRGLRPAREWNSFLRNSTDLARVQTAVPKPRRLCSGCRRFSGLVSHPLGVGSCFFSFWGEQGTETLPLLMIFWFLGISYGSSLILNSPAELSFWNQLNPQPNL